MPQTTAHFVFTLSGGGCLLQALRMAGRDDPVVCTVDDLSLGQSIPPMPLCARNGLRKSLAGPLRTTFPTLHSGRGTRQSGYGTRRFSPGIERSHGSPGG